jgi:hypothetical protein
MSKAQQAAATSELDKDDIDLLPERQQAALVGLLKSRSVKEAADSSGVSERTLFRFLRDPAFSEHYQRMRRQVVEAAVLRLQADASDAAQVLRDVARDSAAPAAARVSAARLTIELAYKGIEQGDLQQRIGSLEEYQRRKAEEDELKKGRPEGEEDDD